MMGCPVPEWQEALNELMDRGRVTLVVDGEGDAIDATLTVHTGATGRTAYHVRGVSLLDALMDLMDEYARHQTAQRRAP